MNDISIVMILTEKYFYSNPTSNFW